MTVDGEQGGAPRSAVGTMRAAAIAAAGRAAVELDDAPALWGALWEQLAAADEAIGLQLGACLRVEDLDLLGELLASSATFGQALGYASRYDRLVGDGHALRVERLGDQTVLELRVLPDGAPAVRRAAVDFGLCAVLGVLRELSGERVVPRAVLLPYARPSGFVALSQAFGCELQFGAERGALRLGTQWLDRPLPAPPGALLQRLRSRLPASFLRALEGLSASARVRRALVELLPAGVPDLATVTRALATGEEALQRQLRREGPRFHDLLEDTRRELASALLDGGQLLDAEVALLAGYPSAVALRRALSRG